MAASSFFGSLGELARHRNAKISVEQDKQDKLTERMRKAQIQGVKSQQDKYDKQKAYYDQVDGLIGKGNNNAGIISAMDLASQANTGVASAKAVKEFTGKDKEMEIDFAAQYKNMREQVDFFRKENTRPELTPEDIDKIQARRGVDNLGFEKSIKNLLGIDASKDYYGTPLVGLKTMQGDVSAGVSYKDKEKGAKDLKWEQRIMTDPQSGKVRQITYAINQTDGTLISGDSKLLKKAWKTNKDGSVSQDKETKVSAEETRTIDSIARNIVQQKWSEEGEGTKILMEMFSEVIDPTTNKIRSGAITRGQQVLYSIYEGLKSETPSANTGEIAALSIKAMEILNDSGAFTKKPVEGSGFTVFGKTLNQDEYLDILPTVTLYRINPNTGKWQAKNNVPVHRAGVAAKKGFVGFKKLPSSTQEQIMKRRGAQ